MDEALRAPIAKAVRKCLQLATPAARAPGYVKPHAIVFLTDHVAGEVVLSLGHRPGSLDDLTEVARISSLPEWVTAWSPARAAATADDLASIAYLVLHMARQSGWIDELRPARPLELIAIANGETTTSARVRASEIEREIAESEDDEQPDEV